MANAHKLTEGERAELVSMASGGTAHSTMCCPSGGGARGPITLIVITRPWRSELTSTLPLPCSSVSRG